MVAEKRGICCYFFTGSVISFPLFLEFPLLSLLNYNDNMSLIFMTSFHLATKLRGIGRKDSDRVLIVYDSFFVENNE